MNLPGNYGGFTAPVKMFYSAALTGVVMICSFLFWAACKQDLYELVSAFLSPGVW